MILRLSSVSRALKILRVMVSNALSLPIVVFKLSIFFNVHRGMVLGLTVGAANDELPEHLIQGLTARNELKDEIVAFGDIAMSAEGI